MLRLSDDHRTLPIGVTLTLALASLAAGAAVYLLVRGPASLYILGSGEFATTFRLPSTPGIRTIANSLPAAAHAFALSLLTALVLPPRHYLRACAAWLLVDTAFEVVQAAKTLEQLLHHAGVVPSIVHAYIAYGVFDWFDVAAIWIGAGSAALVLRPLAQASHNKGGDYDVDAHDRPAVSVLLGVDADPRQQFSQEA